MRLAKLEARLAPAPGGTVHVLRNIGGRGCLKTAVELDREEAALRASGAVRPGDTVTRLLRVIVDLRPHVGRPQ